MFVNIFDISSDQNRSGPPKNLARPKILQFLLILEKNFQVPPKEFFQKSLDSPLR